MTQKSKSTPAPGTDQEQGQRARTSLSIAKPRSPSQPLQLQWRRWPRRPQWRLFVPERLHWQLRAAGDGAGQRRAQGRDRSGQARPSATPADSSERKTRAPPIRDPPNLKLSKSAKILGLMSRALSLFHRVIRIIRSYSRDQEPCLCTGSTGRHQPHPSEGGIEIEGLGFVLRDRRTWMLLWLAIASSAANGKKTASLAKIPTPRPFLPTSIRLTLRRPTSLR